MQFYRTGTMKAVTLIGILLLRQTAAAEEGARLRRRTQTAECCTFTYEQCTDSTFCNTNPTECAECGGAWSTIEYPSCGARDEACSSSSDCCGHLTCEQGECTWANPAPSPVSFGQATDLFGNSNCDYGECVRCQGDCDFDDECADGLICYERDDNSPVPGCLGTGVSGRDYCTVPPPLDYIGDCSSASPCGLCQGDCDNDAQCEGDLICQKRDSFEEPIQGCTQGGADDRAKKDYCVHPRGPVIEYIGECTSSSPCVHCQGDCDDDNDCEGDLVCVQRSRFETVRGCAGHGRRGKDICAVPEGLPKLTASGDCDGSCGLCEGDCDSDGDCSGNLVCGQRSGYALIEGCEGPGNPSQDYCIADTSPVTPPVAPPVAPPVVPPVVPTNPPVAPPVAAPVAPPVAPPVAAPVAPPVAPPVAAPVAPPVATNELHGNSNCDYGECGMCEGDCDFDAECQSGLICYHRSDSSPVPGCTGTGIAGKDYCTVPPPLVHIGDCSSSSPCGLCVGDCDHDGQCEGDLVCHQRDSFDEPIIGCTQGGTGDLATKDYCIYPRGPVVEYIGECDSSSTCGLCQGDCDSDSGCAGDLVCVQRSDYSSIRGCAGHGDSGDDVCTHPAGLPKLTSTGDCEGGCGLCEGDCDSDSDCNGDLVCAQRSGYDLIEGCEGPGEPNQDYCVSASNAPAPTVTPPGTPAVHNYITFNGENSCTAAAPCDECVGGCVTNSDCLGAFECLQRTGSNPIPGCVTGGPLDVADKKYCQEPVTGGPVTYIPGFLNSTSSDGDLLLSHGLSARRIADSNLIPGFHSRPDGAGIFEKSDGSGYYYVSNAEDGGSDGGVGSIEFDNNGNVVGYVKVATQSEVNCGGGKTWWGTWLTCEEFSGGQVWEVAPDNSFTETETMLGGAGGKFESAAYYLPDINGVEIPTFYVTEDSSNGAFRQWTPSQAAWDLARTTLDYRPLLTDPNGELKYLKLTPSTGTFSWITSKSTAQADASTYYANSEGLDIVNGKAYITAKSPKILLILDLVQMTYERSSTVSGAFEQQPDQIRYLLNNDSDDDILYFCEDGGDDSGVHGRDKNGNFYSILDGPGHNSETTGLDFSPDGLRMYVSFQSPEIIYEVTRDDGYPFNGMRLDIKYHAV